MKVHLLRSWLATQPDDAIVQLWTGDDYEDVDAYMVRTVKYDTILEADLP